MFFSKDVAVELNVLLQPFPRGRRPPIDQVQLAPESLVIAVDHGPSEIRLGRKIIVDARIANSQLGGDVRITKSVEAPGLNQLFGQSKDSIFRRDGGAQAHIPQLTLLLGGRNSRA